MEVLNQTWKKTKKGMVLAHEKRVQVPDPEPTQEDRMALLEAKVKHLMEVTLD